MRNLIFAINITLDGCCDHTKQSVDEEKLDYFTRLTREADLAQLDKKPVALPYVRTFMNVPVGEPLLYIDSRGRVAIAVNQGNYSQKYKITPPVPIFIPRKSAPLKAR